MKQFVQIVIINIIYTILIERIRFKNRNSPFAGKAVMSWLGINCHCRSPLRSGNEPLGVTQGLELWNGTNNKKKLGTAKAKSCAAKASGLCRSYMSKVIPQSPSVFSRVSLSL